MYVQSPRTGMALLAPSAQEEPVYEINMGRKKRRAGYNISRTPLENNTVYIAIKGLFNNPSVKKIEGKLDVIIDMLLRTGMEIPKNPIAGRRLLDCSAALKNQGIYVTRKLGRDENHKTKMIWKISREPTEEIASHIPRLGRKKYT